MKKQMSVFVAVALFASMTLAQGKSVTRTRRVADPYSSKGFRVSLIAPIMETEASISGGDLSLPPMKEKMRDAVGLSVGYASLPIQALGWTSNFAYINSKENSGSVGLMRLDGNLGVALNRYVNVKGGLNIAKPVGFAGSEFINPGFGFQASAGVQINRNFGIDFGYTAMNQNVTGDVVRVDLKQSGFELALNGTF